MPNTHLTQLEVYDTEKTVSFPVRFDRSFDVDNTNLLSRMVEVWGEVPIALIQHLDIRHSLYGYIGLQDNTLSPLLRPGSFVQIDPHVRKVQPLRWRTEFDRPIYFVELRDGYACSWCEMQDGYSAAAAASAVAAQRATPQLWHRSGDHRPGDRRGHAAYRGVRSRLLTEPPDCQSESDVRQKQPRHRRIHFHRNRNSIGLQLLPDAQNIGGDFPCEEFRYNSSSSTKFLQRIRRQPVKNVAMRDFQRLAGSVGDESARQVRRDDTSRCCSRAWTRDKSAAPNRRATFARDRCNKIVVSGLNGHEFAGGVHESSEEMNSFCAMEGMKALVPVARALRYSDAGKVAGLVATLKDS